MMHGIYAAAVFAALILLPGPSSAGDVTVEPFYRGALAESPPDRSSLIRDEEGLADAWEALGIKDPMPEVDFTEEAVLLVIAGREPRGVIEIVSVGSEAHGVMEVRYTVKPRAAAHGGKPGPVFPYLFAKIRPAPGRDAAPVFKAEGAPGGNASGTAIGQFAPYTNVLPGGDTLRAAEYIPLDKGNVWTYAVKSAEGSREVTNTVISESDGWSVFDRFFGAPSLGMRIAPGGEIYVRSGGGVETFYNSLVVTEFPDKGVATPAGRFDDVMVVTVPEGGEFWFRDVYAKGVGLVLHEHRSPRGDAEYVLKKATVGGRKYPVSD